MTIDSVSPTWSNGRGKFCALPAMPPQSRYLARILPAAENSITAAQLARVLDLPLSRASEVLRYWERAGYLLPHYERYAKSGGRIGARYSLTLKGKAALHEQRHDAPHDTQQQTGD